MMYTTVACGGWKMRHSLSCSLDIMKICVFICSILKNPVLKVDETNDLFEKKKNI